MSNEGTSETKAGSVDGAGVLRTIEAVGWGSFFVWVGVALLLDVGWGIGLLGVGIITLGGQMARRYYGLKLDGFQVVIGLLFAAGGIWELFQIQVSLVPFLLIAAGAALFASVFRTKKKASE